MHRQSMSIMRGDHQDDNVRLREVPFARFMELETRFEDPELSEVAARLGQPDPVRLYRRIFANRLLLVWDVFPTGSAAAVGYATLYHSVRVHPSLYVYFFAAAFDDKVAQDVTTLMAHTIFAKTEAEALDYILPGTEVEDDPFVRFLVDLGFDRNEESRIDHEVETCYTLQRHTYDAYHGSDYDSDDTDPGLG